MAAVPQETQEPEAPLAGDEAVEDVEQQVAHREWTFSDGSETRTYKQKPLSFMAKIEFFGLLGRTIDRAMAGPDGITVDGILGANPVSQEFTLTSGTDNFVAGIAKLASYAPDLLDHCVCIWLRVPQGERPWLNDLLQKPVDEGGLDDDTGQAILETFIDQNYEEMERFFTDRVRKMGKRIQSKRQRIESRPSRRSKPSARNTPSA